VDTVSGTTLWRWLEADAIRPWRHRSWLFPRDPPFAECADPILDLYERRWDGRCTPQKLTTWSGVFRTVRPIAATVRSTSDVLDGVSIVSHISMHARRCA